MPPFRVFRRRGGPRTHSVGIKIKRGSGTYPRRGLPGPHPGPIGSVIGRHSTVGSHAPCERRPQSPLTGTCRFE